jgi:primosomal protein DnaI
MEKYSFGKVDEKALANNFAKALKDDEFVKVVNSLNVSDEVKVRYTSNLQEIAEVNIICDNCKGLSECPYDIIGLRKVAVANNNVINFMYKKCDYKEKDDKEKEYLNNVYSYKMPKEIREASFKNIYKDDSNRLETIKYLKKFYDSFKKGEKEKGLYLYGNFGCGKTYLISALFNELAKKNIKSTIIYFPELLRSLKASFSNPEENYEERFSAVKEANLLLLDDIGAEKLSDWARDEVLGVILQYRMEEHLPTFFTSNLSLKELEEHLQISKSSEDKIKARRIIERIKYLTEEIEMNSVNRRV